MFRIIKHVSSSSTVIAVAKCFQCIVGITQMVCQNPQCKLTVGSVLTVPIWYGVTAKIKSQSREGEPYNQKW
ncbi:hypothetical protein VIBHAR_06670 [Vibrio campbellii ATCC BAA-1116]|uniref:Uncharacterized protein n=1 Tax=Vibrio campbellii (strain ATCC BAA-1116) TaxID=2902295 RepID=A7N714_VIBC1|nr:hypothetical protein VIBHAR_06670 [Vibrio campbellii ATCC BAA-1116]